MQIYHAINTRRTWHCSTNYINDHHWTQYVPIHTHIICNCRHDWYLLQLYGCNVNRCIKFGLYYYLQVLIFINLVYYIVQVPHQIILYIFGTMILIFATVLLTYCILPQQLCCKYNCNIPLINQHNNYNRNIFFSNMHNNIRMS